MRIAGVALALMLAGCGLAAEQRAADARAGLNSLDIGMSKAEVLRIMGQPWKREAYKGVEFLIYKTSRNGDYTWDGPQTETPIAIVDGKVAGWGRNYYETVIRQQVDVTVRQH